MDYSDKSWLRSTSVVAYGALREGMFLIGVATIVIAAVMLLQLAASRDALLEVEHKRHADIAECKKAGAVAYRHLESNRLVCFGGPGSFKE